MVGGPPSLVYKRVGPGGRTTLTVLPRTPNPGLFVGGACALLVDFVESEDEDEEEEEEEGISFGGGGASVLLDSLVEFEAEEEGVSFGACCASVPLVGCCAVDSKEEYELGAEHEENVQFGGGGGGGGDAFAPLVGRGYCPVALK